MRAYYNEIDPFAVDWLQRLIKAGLIAEGDVDDRSIEDVYPEDLKDYTQCHFFAGIGVWSYALRQAKWADDRQVWTGSCPCQPFSSAGKRKGFADERHLWPAWFHLIRECRPSVVFGEQVATKGGIAWLDLISFDLEGINYLVGKANTCAAGFGAPHIRQRHYFVGDTQLSGLYVQQESQKSEIKRGVFQSQGPGPANGFWKDAVWLFGQDGKRRALEPGTLPLAYGVANGVGRVRGYGNTLCVPQAQAFIESYMEVAHKSWINHLVTLGEELGQ